MVYSGHYTNLIRRNELWVKTNDLPEEIKVEKWSTHEKQPYLIFLERKFEKSVSTENK